MLQLDAVLTEESTEEVRRWDRKPVLMEVGERHRLTRLREREGIPDSSPPPSNFLQRKETSLHQPHQPRLHHLRRYPLTHLNTQKESRAAVEIASYGKHTAPRWAATRDLGKTLRHMT